MESHEPMIAFARAALQISQTGAIQVVPFPGRGSDRRYFRLSWDGNQSAILVHYELSRIENSYFADIARFLSQICVPVPRLIAHDPSGHFILVEDLGDADLWGLREAAWETRRILYRKTLAAVHRLHSFPEEEFPARCVKLMQPFGPELYRWEREYFLENFVAGYCGMDFDGRFGEALEKELCDLGQRLSAGRRCLVHRDLQSQNVMLCDGEPFLIDFQGMRFGNAFYDLGSLLCDPYVRFSTTEREELLSYYYSLSKQAVDWDSYRSAFWEASAQRLMQALGAYGFLGFAKGLTNYLVHIPAGLRNLRAAAGSAASLPELWKLAGECERKMCSSV